MPNLSAQNVNTFVPLERGNCVIMSTKLRFYVGEVLDIYKQAAGSRYGSIDDATTASGLSYLALRVYLPLQVQLVSDTECVFSFMVTDWTASWPRKTLMMRCHLKIARHLYFRVGTITMIYTRTHRSTNSFITLGGMPSLEVTVHMSHWRVHTRLSGSDSPRRPQKKLSRR